MLTFTDIINESRNRVNYDSVSLLSSEINKYINKVNKEIPKNVQDVIYLTQKYNLLNSLILQDIIDANKSQLEKLSKELDIQLDVLSDIQKQLKGLKKNIRLLPQFQTEAERQEIMAGKLAANDLTIDLVSTAGRNAVAKMYTPLVLKLVNNYVGKSSLDKAALISAGMLGLTNAINTYDKNKSKMTFKSYASYCIVQSILDDMNNLSHTISTNWYGVKNGSNVDIYSLDNFMKGDDDDDFNNDHLAALGEYDDYDSKDKEKIFNELYKMIESKFSVRDCDIYYRYMGLKDYWGLRQKSKEIAKMYGMSEGNVKNAVVNKINKFIQNSPRAMSLMREIRESYEISLLNELIYFEDKQTIYENLISNDMFILLEEINKWNDLKTFKNIISQLLDKLSIEDAKYFIDCLEKGFDFIDDTYKKHKKLLIFILRELYPTDNFNNKSDVAIIDYMNELSKKSNEFKIKW